MGSHAERTPANPCERQVQCKGTISDACEPVRTPKTDSAGLRSSSGGPMRTPTNAYELPFNAAVFGFSSEFRRASAMWVDFHCIPYAAFP
jgi:hypothetical protein